MPKTSTSLSVKEFKEFQASQKNKKVPLYYLDRKAEVSLEKRVNFAARIIRSTSISEELQLEAFKFLIESFKVPQDLPDPITVVYRLLQEKDNQSDINYIPIYKAPKVIPRINLSEAKNEGYFENQKISLGEDIAVEQAWQILISENKQAKDIKKPALVFLANNFNISTELEDEELVNVVFRAVKGKKDNMAIGPEFKIFSSERKANIKERKTLIVNKNSQIEDIKTNIKYLTPEARKDYEITISQGVFKKNGAAFDTTSMSSHEKSGFAAFTLNTKMQMHAFTHTGKSELAHSSMNAGEPVIFSGEFKIEKGKLKALTTYSGHYNPTLFNVYQVLDYFTKQGIDISEAQLLTINKPNIGGRPLENSTRMIIQDKKVNPLPKMDEKTSTLIKKNEALVMYKTPATEIYKLVDHKLDRCMKAINSNLKSYKNDDSLKGILIRLWGSKLTKEREKLADTLISRIGEVASKLPVKMNPKMLKSHIENMEKLINEADVTNKNLSRKAGKNPEEGRLAAKISEFKNQINELKRDVPVEDDPNRLKNTF